jgi:hypothetical protein
MNEAELQVYLHAQRALLTQARKQVAALPDARSMLYGQKRQTSRSRQQSLPGNKCRQHEMPQSPCRLPRRSTSMTWGQETLAYQEVTDRRDFWRRWHLCACAVGARSYWKDVFFLKNTVLAQNCHFSATLPRGALEFRV